MGHEKIINNNIVNSLTKRLENLQIVSKYNEGDEKEAYTLAYTFSELEDCFHKLLYELFPKLREKDVSGEKLRDLLFEIGDELRHLNYHLKDPKFFRVYLEE